MFALAAAVLVWLTFAQAWWNPIQDPDLFWQLWAGRQMLAGQLPTLNSFSWTAPQTPWILHEPLVALGYAAVGLAQVGLMRGLIVSITAVLLTLLAWRRENAWATVLALGWACLLVFYGNTERALTWGNLMLALLALLLYGVEPRRRWRLPLAAILVALWANVHGSFIIGILMVGLVHWGWGLLAAALCLLNPHGFQIYGFLLGYGLGSGAKAFVHAQIPEWAPVHLASPLDWLRLGCLLLAGYLLIRDRQWRLVFLWAFIGALAVLHQRFFDLLGIALLPAMSDALARRLPPREIWPPAPLVAAAMLVTALLSPVPGVDQYLYPTPILAHLPAAARVWNPHYLGGWLGYQGRRCFWDSRNDCYPLEVLEDGLQIEHRRPGWLETLQRWQVDAVLTPDAALAKELSKRQWEEAARSGDLVLLLRPAAAKSAN